MVVLAQIRHHEMQRIFLLFMIKITIVYENVSQKGRRLVKQQQKPLFLACIDPDKPIYDEALNHFSEGYCVCVMKHYAFQ
mmetsp:Transcript_29656/g.43360  ORF Transcript_29656/g.43360 Transcript_29656/m.43360 type:complete len:80 (+) Transcript_29656:319-558(+)